MNVSSKMTAMFRVTHIIEIQNYFIVQSIMHICKLLYYVLFDISPSSLAGLSYQKIVFLGLIWQTE